MTAGAAQGLFFRDTRILSRFEVLVNGARPSRWPRSPTIRSAPHSCPGTCRPGRADSTLMVFRSPPRGPGNARGADPPQFRRRGHRLHHRRVRRSRLRRPVRGEGGAGGGTDTGDATTVIAGQVSTSGPPTGRQWSGDASRPGPADHTDLPSLPARPRGPGRGDPVDRRRPGHRRPGHLRGGRAGPGRVDDLRRGGPGHRRDAVRPQVPLRRTGRAGHALPSAWPSGVARCPRSRPTTGV